MNNSEDQSDAQYMFMVGQKSPDEYRREYGIYPMDHRLQYPCVECAKKSSESVMSSCGRILGENFKNFKHGRLYEMWCKNGHIFFVEEDSEDKKEKGMR